jgi:hypothetical protein
LESDDRYLVQLRRELTRSQAQLGRAERDRDRLRAENEALRALLKDKGIEPPRRKKV